MTHTKLHHLANSIREKDLSQIGASRADIRPLSACGWSIDTSRHFLNDDVDAALMSLANERDLGSALSRLFDGEIVNPSENRPALHWALRCERRLEGLPASVRGSVVHALDVAQQIATGHRKTVSGAPFNAIVHIGIGGSDFGPRLVADAFADTALRDIDLRFCANLDPLDLQLALGGLDPTRTLVIGISKSFGTEETLYNLSRARDWLKREIGDAWPRHLALVTASPSRAKTWLDGADGLLLDMPESVGGRFSIWSAGSLACMTGLKAGVFEDFLRGAFAMDEHVRTQPIADNVAARLALLDVWNTSYLGFSARAVLAYSRRLRMLPTYLQQLEMESNGKGVGPDGVAVEQTTTPLLWGGEGTIGQHSYHQWLHQGMHVMPTEFILAPGSLDDAAGVTALTAHALAQAEVLANGRSLESVLADEPELDPRVAAQKVHAGGRPSTFMHTEELTPFAMGALIALYEHRTYLAGVLWGVNSFDQWGVERGKTMAGRLKPAMTGSDTAADATSARLISMIKSSRDSR